MLSWTFGMDPKKFSPVDWKRTRQLTPISELRREMGVDWSTIPQKKEKEDVSEANAKDRNLFGKIITDKEEFCPLTKLAYQSIVKAKRREQVHNLFLEEIEQVFDQLEERAMQMTDCHFEVAFDINIAYDIDKVEVLLRDYFLDLGFDVIVAERNDERSGERGDERNDERNDERKVVFTLT